MKKLFILMAVILIASLLVGFNMLPEIKLISIVVEPGGIYLNPEETRAIESITACYEDWSIKKIAFTNCKYLSFNTKIATVDSEGLITAKSIGEAIILVSYMERNFWTGKISETDVVCVQVED